MRNHLRSQQRSLLCLLLCLVIAILVIRPATAADDSKVLVNKLWSIYAMDKLLEQIKTSMLSGEENLLANLESENKAKVAAIIEQNFADIKTSMLQYMTQHGRTTTLKQAYNFLETPLGNKISDLKISSATLYNDPEVGIPISRDEMSAERAALQTRFETIAFPTVNTYLSQTLDHFMRLQNHSRPPEQRLTEAQLEQQIRLATVKVSGITSTLLPHVFTRTYAPLSLEEVTVYLNYLDSEAGRHVNDLMLDAYIHALKESRPRALLSLSKLFEDELAILSPYSKEKLTDAKQRELMALLIKQHGKPTVISAMLEARAGQMTIFKNGDSQEVFGRPNQDLVTLDTLMTDLDKSGMDIRRFYLVVQKKLRSIN